MRFKDKQEYKNIIKMLDAKELFFRGPINKFRVIHINLNEIDDNIVNKVETSIDEWLVENSGYNGVYFTPCIENRDGVEYLNILMSFK